MKSFLFLASAIAFLNIAESARILAIVPTPSYSHQVALWPVWQALSQKGHDVTLITTLVKPNENITQIDVSNAYNESKRKELVGQATSSQANVIERLKAFTSMKTGVQRAGLLHNDVKALIAKNDLKFDVVIAESWVSAFLAFGVRYNAPTIAISSFQEGIEYAEAFGNPSHPVLYPPMLYSGPIDMSLKDRFSAIVTYLLLKIIVIYEQSIQNELIQTHFGAGYPTNMEIIDNLDLMFVNCNPTYHRSKPSVPGFINIGGDIQKNEPKPLPKVHTK